jgi:hypothetical protein
MPSRIPSTARASKHAVAVEIFRRLIQCCPQIRVLGSMPVSITPITMIRRCRRHVPRGFLRPVRMPHWRRPGRIVRHEIEPQQLVAFGIQHAGTSRQLGRESLGIGAGTSPSAETSGCSSVAFFAKRRSNMTGGGSERTSDSCIKQRSEAGGSSLPRSP